MESIEELRKRLDAAVALEDTLDRRLWVLGVITEALAEHGVTPILVGGGAVEFYTGGGYATKDVDIVVPNSQYLAEVMSGLGFVREGRHWFRQDIDYAMEAPGEELAGELKRVLEVGVNDTKVYIVGIEDLIADRLNAAVHWKSADDRRWAERLFAMHRETIDLDYLRVRSRADGTSAVLDEILGSE